MSHLIKRSYQSYLNRENSFTHIHLLAALLARLYVAQVFFSAGLTKVKDWETTLFLFEEEYQVPLLNYEAAAVLGTLGELILPVLLLLGILTRFSAVGLFLVNVVAVISLAEIAPAALYLHYLWGILLAQIIVYGPGPLALDSFARKLMLKA